MKRNCDPRGRCRSRTGLNAGHCHHRVAYTRKQPPRRETRNTSLAQGNRPDGFVCAFCGAFSLWKQIAGFDGPLKFCQMCIDGLNALSHGVADALAIFRANGNEVKK